MTHSKINYAILHTMEDCNLISADWEGLIEGVSYTLGGEFVDSCRNCQMVITTHNNLTRTKASNVVGYLKGQVEPDR